MVEFASLLVVSFFACVVINSLGKWNDLRVLGRKAEALTKQLQAESDKRRREELQDALDRLIETAQIVENRSVLPFR